MTYKIGQIHFEEGKEPTLGNNIISQISQNVAIVQLGIQAPPGTIFLLNNVDNTSESDIEIGITGIFELDLRDANTAITWLSFEKINKPIDEEGNIKPWNIQIDYLIEG